MLQSDPDRYQKAKSELASFRNAKYRRAGALAIDIQLETLERLRGLIANLPVIEEEACRLGIQSVVEGWQAALDDPEARQEAARGLARLSALERMIQKVRSIRLREISAVGEAAERRADLNEGKATARVEMADDELTLEEVEATLREAKEAGTGIDHGSIL